MEYLRRNRIGTQPSWSKAELIAGFKYYHKLHGRMPTAYEIDDFPYLPSARSIQRSFGGLVSLRSEMLHEQVDFTKGAHRGVVAKRMYWNGVDYEMKFFGYLTTQFREVAVHEHKVIRPGNVNCDFYIYLSEEAGVVVDIFYAAGMRELVNIVNLKQKRYALVKEETYLVIVGNPSLANEQVREKMQKKRVPLPSNVDVVTEAYFKEAVVSELTARSIFTAAR